MDGSLRDYTLSVLIIAVLCGNVVTACVFMYFIWMSNWRRTLALQGDASAAVRILLPCYRPIFRLMAFVYLLSAVGLGLSFLTRQSVADQFYVLQFASLMMLTTFAIVPILLMQPSVSYKAFWTTASFILPWFTVCTVIWTFMTRYKSGVWLMTGYWIFSSLPTLVLGTGLRCGWIKSRVHINSASNRLSIEYMLVYSIFYTAINLVAVTSVQTNNHHQMKTMGFILAIVSVGWNQFFPWSMYVTLLADTKFWRGLGRHNQAGFVTQEGHAARPGTMDIRLVTHDLQGVMREIGDLAVDFAFLDVHKLIGKGAHASVYNGKLKNESVAIKLFTPEEVNQEVIQEFVREAKLSMPLLHPNIVNFMGICMRPPQIAMIMELCPGGDLKSNLVKNALFWSPTMRMQACLDCTYGVSYLHAKGFIHRDIKAENFFVSGDICAIDHEVVTGLLAPLTIEEMQAERDQLEERESFADQLRESIGFARKHSIAHVTSPKSIVSPTNIATKGFSIKLGDFGESTKQRLKSDGTVEVIEERLYNTQARGNAGKVSEDDTNEIKDEETESVKMYIKGTGAYMAPELVKRHKKYSEKIDIYSLGITFLEIWTGEDPWKNKTSDFQIYTAVENGERPVIPNDVPQSLRNIILSCWEDNGDDRPSAEHLCVDLEACILVEYSLDMRRQKQYMAKKVQGSLVENKDVGILPNVGKAIKNVFNRRLSSLSNRTTNSSSNSFNGGGGRSAHSMSSPVTTDLQLTRQRNYTQPASTLAKNPIHEGTEADSEVTHAPRFGESLAGNSCQSTSFTSADRDSGADDSDLPGIGIKELVEAERTRSSSASASSVGVRFSSGGL